MHPGLSWFKFCLPIAQRPSHFSFCVACRCHNTPSVLNNGCFLRGRPPLSDQMCFGTTYARKPNLALHLIGVFCLRFGRLWKELRKAMTGWGQGAHGWYAFIFLQVLQGLLTHQTSVISSVQILNTKQIVRTWVCRFLCVYNDAHGVGQGSKSRLFANSLCFDAVLLLLSAIAVWRKRPTEQIPSRPAHHGSTAAVHFPWLVPCLSNHLVTCARAHTHT